MSLLRIEWNKYLAFRKRLHRGSLQLCKRGNIRPRLRNLLEQILNNLFCLRLIHIPNNTDNHAIASIKALMKLREISRSNSRNRFNGWALSQRIVTINHRLEATLQNIFWLSLCLKQACYGALFFTGNNIGIVTWRA